MSARSASAPSARARDCGAVTEGGERTLERSPGPECLRGGDAAPRPKPRRRSDYLRGPSARSGGAAVGERQGARAGHPVQGAGSARVNVRREDAWLRGSRVKATTRHADFQPPPPTHSSPFPWPLASLNATSRCGSLKCYPWDRIPAPPINSCVTP